MTVDQLSDPHASLTNEEYYALHGTLNTTRIEALLEMESKVEGQADAIAHIEEAEECFPQKDFLSGAIDELLKILKRQGEDEDDLELVIERLERAQEAALLEAKCGASELKEAKDAIWVP